MNLIDLENLSGLTYLFWDFEDDEEDDNSNQPVPTGQDLATKLPRRHQWKAFNKKYGKLTKALCEVIENYMGFHGYLLCDLESRELLCHIVGQLDKANQYFGQPEKTQNKKEAAIDYQAVEMYVQTEAVQDIYDKYIECDDLIPAAGGTGEANGNQATATSQPETGAGDSHKMRSDAIQESQDLKNGAFEKVQIHEK